MVDMFQALRARMFLDRPMEKQAFNQALELFTEESINQLILSTNQCSSKSFSSIANSNMRLLPKSLEYRDKKIPTRR
jgi:hypothetical protein